MQWRKIMSKTIHQTSRMDKDMMADDMSTGTIIDTNDTEEEVDSSRIVTYNRVDPPSASYVTKKVTDTLTIHTRTGLILNSVTTVE